MRCFFPFRLIQLWSISDNSKETNGNSAARLSKQDVISLNIIKMSVTLTSCRQLPFLCSVRIGASGIFGGGWWCLPYEAQPPQVFSRASPAARLPCLQWPPFQSPLNHGELDHQTEPEGRLSTTASLSCSRQRCEGDMHPPQLPAFCWGDQNSDNGEPGADDGEESILTPVRNLRGNRASAEALRVREPFYQYSTYPAREVLRHQEHLYRGSAT